MKHLEPNELELKMMAFQQAMCIVLAEVAADVVVLRAILNGREIISDDEYQKHLTRFGEERFVSYHKELSGRIHSTTERILKKLKGEGETTN